MATYTISFIMNSIWIVLTQLAVTDFHCHLFHDLATCHGSNSQWIGDFSHMLPNGVFDEAVFKVKG